MTPNIAGPVFNTLLTAFFLVILLGMALGAYAANELRKSQKRLEECTAPAAGTAALAADRNTAVED